MGTITALNDEITMNSGGTTYYFEIPGAREFFVEDGVLYGYQASGVNMFFGRFDLAPGETLSTDPLAPASLTFTRIQVDDDGDGTTDRDIANSATADERQGGDVFDSDENTLLLIDDHYLTLFDADDNTYTRVQAPGGGDFEFGDISTTGGSSYKVTSLDVTTDSSGNRYLFYTSTNESTGIGKIWRAELNQDVGGDWVISNHVELETNSANNTSGGIGEAHTLDVVANPDAPGGQSIIINGKYITADSVDIFNATTFGSVNSGDYVYLGADQYPGAENAADNGQIIFATWNGDLPAFVCFANGTEIQAQNGSRLVEDLAVGDTVFTLDNGFQQIRWIGERQLTWLDLMENPHLRPIRIRAGALGPDMPTKDLLVSPQHRVLVRSRIAERMFNSAEVLVAAVKLLGLEGVERAEDVPDVTYYHFRMDRHEIVISNGAFTETLLDTPYARELAGSAYLEELEMLDACNVSECIASQAARPIVPHKKARKLVARHAANKKQVIALGVWMISLGRDCYSVA